MNRLRSYRRIEGISQVQLAEQLGISHQLVSDIERGRRSPTCDLNKIGYAPSRFDIPEMSEPLHRQRASTRVASQHRAKELLRLAGEAFIELEAAISPGHRNRLERLGPAVSDDEIAEVATEVRTYVLAQEEARPIQNLTKAVERAGICLVPISGLAGIDGISAWVEDRPVIGLNVSVPGDRFRLSLAHELGHLVMHSHKGVQSEAEANRFASALLMPDDDFESAMSERPTIRRLIELKSVWGISVAALVYRAHQFGYLDDRSYRSMQIQMSKWRKREPASFDIKPGLLLADLVRRSDGDVRRCGERLGLNPTHLRIVIDWRRLRIA